MTAAGVAWLAIGICLACALFVAGVTIARKLTQRRRR